MHPPAILSFRAERPDFFFRAAFWRVGSRSRGTPLHSSGGRTFMFTLSREGYSILPNGAFRIVSFRRVIRVLLFLDKRQRMGQEAGI